MIIPRSSTYPLMVYLIIFLCCTPEAEGVRRVLRGRRTLTRQYFSGLAIPGWSLVLIIALSELLLGVILYFVMRKIIDTKDNRYTHTYKTASTSEV